MKIATLFVLASSLAGMARSRADAPDFDRQVAEVLARRCLDCHSGTDPKGGLDLSRREAAMRGGDSGESIVAGKLDDSPLWEYVDDGTMPPKAPLPEAEKAVLRDWIAGGAKWGTDPIDPYRATTSRRAGRDWWSLRPVARPEVAAGGNSIDGFIGRGLEKAGLKPSPPADRRTLVRRVSFDLLGLPPAPEEVENFVRDDRPDAYERLVDGYLASPHYGERWARPWLDLARFGESNGFEHDEFRPSSWPYRDWVVSALNRDMPYDEFARRQLAGDVLYPDDPGAIEATGFLVAGAFDSVGQGQQSEAMRAVVRQDEIEDIVGTVGQAFLGLTVNCARCHDHKFDPIRQVEYYRMAAALAGVRHGERDLTPLDPEVKAANARIRDLTAQVAAIEEPVRTRLRGEGKTADAPAPIAAWDFDRGPEDRLGPLPVTVHDGGRIEGEGLKVDGVLGFAETPRIQANLKAKTLEAWVRLDNLGQRGGGVMSVQATEGLTFDAIVFGEVEPGRWMAGSENFARTRGLAAPEESEADKRPVQVAITYAEDGTIAAYRDGKPHGTPYRSAPPTTFLAGKAQVVFGMRHSPAGGNRMLAGRVVRARLYDRALTPDEVARSAASAGEFLTAPEVEAALPPARRDERARCLVEVEALRKSLPGRKRQAYAVTPREPGPVHLLTRGNAGQPAEPVSAGGIAAVSGPPSEFGLGLDAAEGERRARLAAWVTSPENPLFARVIVNRIWLGHFGSGLVETPSDFGFNGGKPSHPELLDWLAGELVANRWSLKAIHRKIVTSATYRQSSRPDPAALQKDANDRLLWRKAPWRLEAEMVRDAMLAASGALDPKAGGPGFREFTIHQAPGTISILYEPTAAEGPGTSRRTLYRTWARGGRSGLLDAFDCPDPSTTAPRRASTTTPQQALALLHNALSLRLAGKFADRLRREAGDDPARQVDRAYRLAFGRDPEADEREEARKVVAAHGAEALARALFNSNEFLYVD